MHARTLCPYSVIELDGVKYHHHARGGGLVAESAFAAPTAYVDVGVIVTGQAQVLDNVRLEGHVTVSGKTHLSGDVCVRDNAVISGDCNVAGRVKISDDVRICNHADIDGDMWFSGHSLITHSRLRGTGRHHNARLVNEDKTLN